MFMKKSEKMEWLEFNSDFYNLLGGTPEGDYIFCKGDDGDFDNSCVRIMPDESDENPEFGTQRYIGCKNVYCGKFYARGLYNDMLHFQESFEQPICKVFPSFENAIYEGIVKDSLPTKIEEC